MGRLDLLEYFLANNAQFQRRFMLENARLTTYFPVGSCVGVTMGVLKRFELTLTKRKIV